LQWSESDPNREGQQMNSGLAGSPRGPWWKNLKLTPVMGVAAAVLAAGIFGARYLRQNEQPAPQAAISALQEGSIRVNLNTATLTELESIPGIGEVLAKQIVARRPYMSVDQLLDIRGIGPASLEQLAPYVKVDGATEKLR
jgi:DNA uptake protein ComE-like DNA-binding protein